MIWNETKECMSRDEILNMQGARLKKTVSRVSTRWNSIVKDARVGIEPEI